MAQSVQDIESRRPVMQGEASIWIDTAPERVYGFVSDVSKLGRLSPECHRCEWDAGVTAAAVGATFTGYDRAPGRRWSMRCRVIAADPGRRFAFSAGTDTEEFSRWSYELADEDGGTLVTESYEVATLPPPLRALDQAGLAGRADQLHVGMLATLGRLKAAVEAGPVQLGPGQGTAFPGSSTLTLKDDPAAEGRSFVALEICLPESGGGPPAHRHGDDDEAYYVLEGTVLFDFGGRISNAEPGSYVYVPHGTDHSFGNVGPGPARLLNVVTPKARDFLWELQHLFSTGTDAEELAELHRRYAVELTREVG